VIRNAAAPVKGELPWLKQAKFGNKTTDKGSLSHDENVITITGIAGDDDGARIAFNNANSDPGESSRPGTLPRLRSSAYEGVTVCDIKRMCSGVAWSQKDNGQTDVGRKSG
jgi:hypothetical protein